MATIKRGPAIVLFVAVLAVIAFGFKYAMDNNLIPGLKVTESSVPEADRQLKQYRTSQGIPENIKVSLPSTEETDIPGPWLRVKFWAWNGHMSVIFANGGLRTTKGSLMEKYGVKLILERQDDTNQLRDELLACANEIADGKQDCDSGIHFTTLMGDQLGAQFAGWNPIFAKLCPDCTIEVFAFGGRSDGEDAFLASPMVLADPQNARGIVVAMVPREGDQNIVFYYADQNNLRVNVDPNTYDPDAINIWEANTYTHASELYNSNPCQDRAEVVAGKRTGKRVKTCIDALSTWTPADYTATVGPNARGGLVRIFSTKENSAQMPNAIMGIKRWIKNNFQTTVKFAAAVTEAGEMLRADPRALRKGAELSAIVYNEQDMNFWYSYYLGKEEVDIQGNRVKLGGSLAFTLADNLAFYGINGGSDYFRDTYELFGGYMKKYYPNEVPEIEPYDRIANKSVLRAVAELRKEAAGQQARGVVREFTPAEQMANVSARASWKIEFETGKATFTPAAMRVLEDLRRVLSISQNSLVIIEGHTDSTGDAMLNQTLSEQRALAVKMWLQSQSREAFPDNRLQVTGYGPSRPIGDNNTYIGRAANRRVEIVIGR